MGVASVLFFLLAMVVTTSSYRDYPASRMPDYGLDYDNQELTPSSDDLGDKLPHASASHDYRYDEESDSRKLGVDVDDTAVNTNKRFSYRSTNEDMHVDVYNTQEEFTPEEKPRNRKGKINRRKNSKYNSSGANRNGKYSRNGNVEDNAENDDYRISEEDYRENDEKETERFNRREIMNRPARRKPRERPLNVILRDSDSGYVRGGDEYNVVKVTKERHFHGQDSTKDLLGYEFDDMKRVNNLKEKLPVTTRATTVSSAEAPNTPSTSPPRERLGRRASNPDKSAIVSTKTSSYITISDSPRLELAGSNKSEISLAELSKLSILRKVQKKENLNITLTTKPPVLMQVTNQMQTVVVVASDVEKDIPRVRRVFDDDATHVERAKILMRHKLTANAKDVHELTANWDELICDYIDVSLLSGAPPPCPNFFLSACLAVCSLTLALI